MEGEGSSYTPRYRVGSERSPADTVDIAPHPKIRIQLLSSKLPQPSFRRQVIHRLIEGHQQKAFQGSIWSYAEKKGLRVGPNAVRLDVAIADDLAGLLCHVYRNQPIIEVRTRQTLHLGSLSLGQKESFFDDRIGLGKYFRETVPFAVEGSRKN